MAHIVWINKTTYVLLQRQTRRVVQSVLLRYGDDVLATSCHTGCKAAFVLGPGLHKDQVGTSAQSAGTAANIATAADQLSTKRPAVKPDQACWKKKMG